MFYVTQIRDKKYRKLAGPFATKEEAQLQVETARKKTCEVDLWSQFDSFGVMRDENLQGRFHLLDCKCSECLRIRSR